MHSEWSIFWLDLLTGFLFIALFFTLTPSPSRVFAHALLIDAAFTVSFDSRGVSPVGFSHLYPLLYYLSTLHRFPFCKFHELTSIFFQFSSNFPKLLWLGTVCFSIILRRDPNFAQLCIHGVACLWQPLHIIGTAPELIMLKILQRDSSKKKHLLLPINNNKEKQLMVLASEIAWVIAINNSCSVSSTGCVILLAVACWSFSLLLCVILWEITDLVSELGLGSL